MRLARALFVLLTALAFAACSSGAGPQWTYAPAPPATPRPSAAASGSPAASGTASGSPAASGSPGASGSPAGSGSTAGDTVTVVATSPAQFDTPDLSTAANKAFTLVFDNQDPSAPHNVVLFKPDGSKVDMGDTSFFQGPAKRTYQVAALPAGSYPFHCEVHPGSMKGTLTTK